MKLWSEFLEKRAQFGSSFRSVTWRQERAPPTPAIRSIRFKRQIMILQTEVDSAETNRRIVISRHSFGPRAVVVNLFLVVGVLTTTPIGTSPVRRARPRICGTVLAICRQYVCERSGRRDSRRRGIRNTENGTVAARAGRCSGKANGQPDECRPPSLSDARRMARPTGRQIHSAITAPHAGVRRERTSFKRSRAARPRRLRSANRSDCLAQSAARSGLFDSAQGTRTPVPVPRRNERCS